MQTPNTSNAPDALVQSLMEQQIRFEEGEPTQSLWIVSRDACMDMVLDVVMGIDPMYLLRVPNVGSMNDAPTMEALEFAIEELGVNEIVVCGHSISKLASRSSHNLDASSRKARGPASIVNRAQQSQQWIQQAKESLVQALEHLREHLGVCRAVHTDNVGLHGLFYLVESNLFLKYDENVGYVPLQEAPQHAM